MACCTGQTDCNHIITIGYLKTFTNGLIQNGSGTAQSVDLSSLPTSARTDSYCPTYAQLTGGTLIPIFVNAGNHKWSQNTDGITINGAYDNTQCVKQEDLVATYTRFESLTVTATPSVNISECGGSSTMSYTYTLRKYVKSMDTACTVSTTSTTDTDTTDSGNAAIVYTTNQTWATVSKPTITLAKNGTHDSPARTVTITGTINFRGTSHSATATIGQKALTGDYKFWYHTYEIYSYDSVSISPDYFDCNGGTWEATGYYTNHDWDVYRWQDSCGVNYDSDTDNRNHTYPSYSELYTSGSADTIDCEAISEKFVTGGTVDYHGNTASWTQECESCSGDCPCGETCRFDTIHSGGTIPCTGGSVDIKYDYIVKSVTCDPSTGQRTETITDSGTNLTWATVHADGCNKTSDTIGYEYNVIQEAGPCCPTGDVFTFDDVEIACTGAAATSQNVKYTQVHTNPDTTKTTTSGTTSKSIPGADCNATSNRKLLQAGVIGSTLDAAQPAVYQAAGPCCPTGDVFTFDDVTVDCYASAATTTSVTYTQVHTNPDTTKTTTSGTTSKSIPARECNPNATTRVIQVGNTGTTLATANPKVTQAAGPCCCSCSDFGLGNETLSWTYNETATKTKTYTAGTCISDVVATSNDNWFSVTALTNGNINVTPSGQNTTTSVKNATITVNYKADGSSCTTKTFTVTQAAYGCSCDDLTLDSAPSAWAWNSTTPKTVGITANSVCIDNITASSNTTWFTASIVGNSVSVTPSGENRAITPKTGTIRVDYTSNSTPCYKTFEVSQDEYVCSCSDLSLSDTEFTWAASDTSSNTKQITISTTSTCISNIALSGNLTSFTASLSGNKITVYPNGTNTGQTPYDETFNVTYNSVGVAGSCHKSVHLVQNATACTPASCTCYVVGKAVANNVESTATTADASFNYDVITWTTGATCNVSSAKTDSGTATINVTGLTASTCDSTIQTGTTTWNGHNACKTNGCDSSAVTINWEVNKKQPAGCDCNCGSVTVSPMVLTWAASATTSDTKSITLTDNSGGCLDNVSFSPTTFTYFSASLSGNNITVYPKGTNTTSLDHTETLTVKYDSGVSTGCTSSITLTQNATACTSASCTCYIVGDATANTVSSTATSATVKWPYSAITWTTGYSCDVSSAYTSSGESTQTVTFAAATCEDYTKSGSFTWTGYTACGSNGCSSSDVVVNWFINQEKPAGCDCTCNDLTIVSTPGAWSWNDTSTKGASLTVNSECITNIVPTSNNNWFTTSLVGNNVNVTPSGNNTTSSAKTATITVSYSSNGTPCSDTFDVRQDAAPCQSAECVCYIVGTATASTVSSTATSATVKWPYSAITWTTGYSCDVSSAYTSSGESTQTVKFSPATCEDYTKSGTLTWPSHKACGSNGCSSSDVSVSWSINQEKPAGCDCTCNNLTISSSAESWTYDSTTSKTITITSSNCISNISLVTTGLTKFNATLTTNGISVSPKSVNTAQTVFEESFILEYNSGTLSCSKQITLTQTDAPCSSAECTCYIVGEATANTVSSIATTATVTWPYTAVTNTTAYTCGESSVSSTGTSSTTVSFSAATCEDYTKSGSFPWTGYKLCGANSACTNTDATINWRVNQERPSSCDCDCGSLTLSPTALTWAASSTAVTDINVTSASCVSGITLNTPSHFSATTVNGKIQVKPRSTNTGLTDIVQTLTVNYSYEGAASDSYQYVDLGLPSGTLWATKNVGASSETDFGNYYQYGKGANDFSTTWHDAMYEGTEDPLAASADTATQVMGNGWHTPTKAQFDELFANCNYATHNLGGVVGFIFPSLINGNTIFLPAGGEKEYNDGQVHNTDTLYYWSSKPYDFETTYVVEGGTDSEDYGWFVESENRNQGYLVRGVKDSTAVTSCSSAITLTHQAASCDCANANMTYTFNGTGSSSSNRVPATGGTVTLTYSTNCGDGYILSSSDINGSSVSYVRPTNTIRITVPSTLSTTGKTYTEYLSYASNGNSCTSFTIYQSAYVEECNCSNSDFVMYDAIIPWSGGEQVCIATYVAKCTDNLTFSITGNSASAVTNITTASTGTQYGHAIYGDVTRNYDLYSQRSFTITARFDGSFCQSVTSYQEVGKCECEKFGFSGTSSTSTTLDLGYITGSRNEVTLVGHENMQSIDVIIDGEATWLSYFKNGDTIVFSATTENDSMNSRIAAVQIIERNTDIGDCIRSITIVQAAKPIKKCPYCSIFTDEYDWGDEATIHNQ